jgi:hypothetical protein
MRRSSVLVAALGVLMTAAGARAAPELSANMGCALEAGTGRLLCTVTLTPPPGSTLSWSDAVVVRSPPGAHALRSRVASGRASPERILIGFVLTEGRGGAIEVRARAVTCPEAPRQGACRPMTRLVRYEFVRPGG